MSIREYREAWKPFEYPQFYEIYQKAKRSQWLETEAQMDSDYRDWQSFSEKEKNVIAGILNGFTVLETFVSCYWGEFIPEVFPKHEIVSMARWFSAQERVHADAYAHLVDTLGLDHLHQAFIGDETVQKKLSVFMDPSVNGDKVPLGIFSGAGEGVSLFASFSVLYSFSLQGRLKGLRQLISWSILDEQMHSDAASMLFRLLVEEEGLTKGEEDRIYEGFDLVLRNEDAFLDSIFKEDLEQISKDSVWHFLRYRANNRLCKLGLQPVYSYNNTEAFKIREWFDPLSKGVIDQDFFSSVKEGSGYVARPEQRFDISMLQTLAI